MSVFWLLYSTENIFNSGKTSGFRNLNDLVKIGQTGPAAGMILKKMIPGAAATGIIIKNPF